MPWQDLIFTFPVQLLLTSDMLLMCLAAKM